MRYYVSIYCVMCSQAALPWSASSSETIYNFYFLQRNIFITLLQSYTKVCTVISGTTTLHISVCVNLNVHERKLLWIYFEILSYNNKIKYLLIYSYFRLMSGYIKKMNIFLPLVSNIDDINSFMEGCTKAISVWFIVRRRKHLQ